MSKRAVILAGGRGSRLRPYTLVLPKPLMPIGDYPILEIIIRQLAKCEFTRITLAVNHQAEIIKAFFGNGEKWGIQIDYSLEDKPLSTMAPLNLIEDLPNDFLVMNGDILTDLDFGEFYSSHIKNRSIFTISSYIRKIESEFGVLEVDKSNTLTDFSEKPVMSFEVSMGIYMVSKRAVDFIPKNEFYGFNHLMLDLIKKSQKPKVVRFDGYWLDIGRADDYEQAVREFSVMKKRLL